MKVNGVVPDFSGLAGDNRYKEIRDLVGDDWGEGHIEGSLLKPKLPEQIKKNNANKSNETFVTTWGVGMYLQKAKRLCIQKLQCSHKVVSPCLQERTTNSCMTSLSIHCYYTHNGCDNFVCTHWTI